MASKGSFLDHKNIVLKFLSTLDKNNFVVKWSKCKFFQKKSNGWDLKSQTQEFFLYSTKRKQ